MEDKNLFTSLFKRILEKLFKQNFYISMIFNWFNEYIINFFLNVAMIRYSGNYKQIISAQANEKKRKHCL